MANTIRDVARRAGVSIATVSRVLNDTCPVADDKRQRVLEAVQVLGYRPNPAARSLLKQETGGLGVVLPYVWGEFFSEFLVGIDQAAQENGFFLLIAASHRSETDLKAALQSMHKRVDGLLIMATEVTAEAVHALIPDGMPAVFVNTQGPGDAFDMFDFDNFEGMFTMTTHLLKLGHRRIAFVKGPPGAHDGEQRFLGYRAALAAMAVPPVAALEIEADFSPEAGYEAGRDLLAFDPLPTAVVAVNDYCAIGVMSALREAGIRVPEDVSVAGFDGIPSARFTFPPLSTIHVPIREIGVAAIERLVERLGKGATWAPKRRAFPVKLVLRQSTVQSRDAAQTKAS